MDLVKILLKQPLLVIALILGAGLVALPYVTVDKDNHLLPHGRTSTLPVVIGVGLILVAIVTSLLSFLLGRRTDAETTAGLDFSKVRHQNGETSTSVAGCHIRVVEGRIQDFSSNPSTVIVLPCNEYFDDECAGDTKSALGAYACTAFDGQIEAFTSLVLQECKRKFGPGTFHLKADNQEAESFGAGRCLLLSSPLGRSVPVALVSTTTSEQARVLQRGSLTCFLA